MPSARTRPHSASQAHRPAGHGDAVGARPVAAEGATNAVGQGHRVEDTGHLEAGFPHPAGQRRRFPEQHGTGAALTAAGRPDSPGRVAGVDGHGHQDLVAVDGRDLVLDQGGIGTPGPAVAVEYGLGGQMVPDLGPVVGDTAFDPLEAVDGRSLAGQRGQDGGPGPDPAALVTGPEKDETRSRDLEHHGVGVGHDVVDHPGPGTRTAARSRCRQVDIQEAQRRERLAAPEFLLTGESIEMTKGVGGPLLGRPSPHRPGGGGRPRPPPPGRPGRRRPATNGPAGHRRPPPTRWPRRRSAHPATPPPDRVARGVRTGSAAPSPLHSPGSLIGSHSSGNEDRAGGAGDSAGVDAVAAAVGGAGAPVRRPTPTGPERSRTVGTEPTARW